MNEPCIYNRDEECFFDCEECIKCNERTLCVGCYESIPESEIDKFWIGSYASCCDCFCTHILNNKDDDIMTDFISDNFDEFKEFVRGRY